MKKLLLTLLITAFAFSFAGAQAFWTATDAVDDSSTTFYENKTARTVLHTFNKRFDGQTSLAGWVFMDFASGDSVALQADVQVTMDYTNGPWVKYTDFLAAIAHGTTDTAIIVTINPSSWKYYRFEIIVDGTGAGGTDAKVTLQSKIFVNDN